MPVWVRVDGTNSVVDLGQGYLVEIKGKRMDFTVPD